MSKMNDTIRYHYFDIRERQMALASDRLLTEGKYVSFNGTLLRSYFGGFFGEEYGGHAKQALARARHIAAYMEREKAALAEKRSEAARKGWKTRRGH
ncbi:hypothetical protein H9Q09_11795 [Aurantimonas sp. DM33-3]|uniref:hypothetical protein n=1 Tax=Aurantimonas sp. DM33-3 TaxID=2766955 RepID=UPI001652A666|nr:hypothetical protein [Aurantimonas sp. DM33-3]MBC6716890.1 hypothetical protein [Aurantimonas sp. DM33-3]